ncbi:MAG: AEC family transporter [Geminicoccaceae bacterium]
MNAWITSLDIILHSVIPLFSVIFVGFFAGKARLMDQHAVRTLVSFVFNIAMPALLFRMMATTDIRAIEDWPIIGAYLLAQAPVFIAGMLIGRWVFRQPFAEMTIQGFGSSFSNGVILALPLALSLFGDRGGVPALLIIMLDILLFSIVTLLLEMAVLQQRGRSDRRLLKVVRDIVLSVLGHPLILASVLGIIWGVSGAALPGVVEKTLALTGQAGPPAGLFALGASLSLRKVEGKLWPVSMMVGLKLAIHPILAWVVVTQLFDFDPIYVSVAILFAACPVGANTYVFAEQYESGIETSATAVLVSTGLAMLTISALAIFLTPSRL